MATAIEKVLSDLKARGALKGIDIANMASVSPATVSRWATGSAMPHARTQLLISDLRYVVELLAEIYTPNETRLWLYGKHRLLGGARPIDLIHEGRADEVVGVIESLDEGSYT